MNLQEALGEGLMVTVIGLAIVFSVLLILMIVMILMKKVFYREPEKAAAAPVAPAAVEIPEEPEVDEGELIAVLTAAVAASLNTSTYNLRIKSYRRIGQNFPAWHRAGISDTINSRY